MVQEKLFTIPSMVLARLHVQLRTHLEKEGQRSLSVSDSSVSEELLGSLGNFIIARSFCNISTPWKTIVPKGCLAYLHLETA